MEEEFINQSTTPAFSSGPTRDDDSKKVLVIKFIKEKKKILLGVGVLFFTIILFGAIKFLLVPKIDKLKQDSQVKDSLVSQEEGRATAEGSFGELVGEEEESKAETPTETREEEIVLMGSLTGGVKGGYYSRALAGTTVTASGDRETQTATTKEDGTFYFEKLPVGFYTLSYDHPEYRFGNVKVEVKEGENSASSVLGSLKNPQPLNVSVHSFSDKDGDGKKDDGEPGLDNIMTVYKKSGSVWESYQSLNLDSQGNASASFLALGEYKIEPGSHTYYNKPGNQTFIVDGYGGSKSFSFAYVPTVSEAGFKIYVFNDKDEDTVKDSGEEYIHYQYAKITHVDTGKVMNMAVSTDGIERTYVELGQYDIELVPQDSSWDYYYKITKRSVSIRVTATTDQRKVELGAHKLI